MQTEMSKVLKYLTNKSVEWLEEKGRGTEREGATRMPIL